MQVLERTDHGRGTMTYFFPYQDICILRPIVLSVVYHIG